MKLTEDETRDLIGALYVSAGRLKQASEAFKNLGANYRAAAFAHYAERTLQRARDAQLKIST